MIMLIEIVQQAIKLAEAGNTMTTDLGTQVQTYDNGELAIIYSTPFSGVEAFPDQPTYMVSIWFQGKKTFAIDYLDLRELEGKRKQIKPWITALQQTSTVDI